MTDLDDPNSVRSLLKKLWCHGQAISPFQGLAYAVWALSDDAAVSGSFRILLWVAALKFPVWGYVSWRCLQLRYGGHSITIVAVLGLVVVAIDLLIVHTGWTNGEFAKSWPLMACIATGLHAVETSAFLSAVACFRWALTNPNAEYHERIAGA